jgi:hypothetical protein
MRWVFVVNFAMYMPVHCVSSTLVSSPFHPTCPISTSVTSQFYRLLNFPWQPSSYAQFFIFGKIVSYSGFLLRTDDGVRNFLRNTCTFFAKVHRFAFPRMLLARFKHFRMLRRVVGFVDFDISITYCFRFWGKSGLKGRTFLLTSDAPMDHSYIHVWKKRSSEGIYWVGLRNRIIAY